MAEYYMQNPKWPDNENALPKIILKYYDVFLPSAKKTNIF